MKYRIYLMIFIGIFFLQACQTLQMLPDQKDIVKNFQPVSISKSKPYPTKDQLNSNLRTIVIGKIDTEDMGNIPKAFIKNSTDLNAVLKVQIEKYLREVGAKIFDVNDRKREELVNAAKRNEMLTPYTRSGKKEYIDYVIIPKVASLDSSVEYTERRSLVEIISGKESGSPKCVHEAKISGTLRVYNGTSRQMEESIYFTASAYDTKEIQKNRTCRKNKSVVKKLITRAGEKAINRNKTKLKNVISPIAFIQQMKMNKESNRYVVRINCGKRNKIRKNLNVNISEYKRPQIIGDRLGTGKVTNWIEHDYSWVLLENSEGLPQKIKDGSIAQIEYKQTIFESIKDIILNLFH